MEERSCPVCAEPLVEMGEAIKSFGQVSSEPTVFGKIVSMECGHRMHRDCLVRWLTVAPEASCPMCRTLTAWRPTITEHENLSVIMRRGFEVLNENEQRMLKWIWILALVIALTDRVGFYFLSAIILAITPPPFYVGVASFLTVLGSFFVGGKSGERMLLGVSIGFLCSVIVVSNHVVEEY
jgi:hypothetical protein